MSVDPGSRGWNEHRHLPVSISNSLLSGYPWHNADLGPDISRANQLANGGFEIWQRGNGPYTATSAFFADRWQIILVGTDTQAVSKDTTHIAPGSLACAACTFVLGTGAGASFVHQTLRLSDGHQLAGRAISFSLQINTAAANALRIAISTDGTGGVTTYSAFHPGDGTYRTLTVPNIVVPANATYIDLNVYFAASCTAYLDNAMLVIGSVAADYMPLQPADDLARCLRYYELLGGTAWNKFGAGVCFSTTQANAHVSFRAQKTVTPSVTLSAAASFAVGVTSNIVATAVTTDIVTPTALSITTTVAAGLTGGWGALLEDNGGGGTRASVALEANP